MNVKDVNIIPLKKIADERGAVMHMLRSDQVHFKQFGEIYFSLIKPGVVKGWKIHKKISQNMAVPEGKIQLVIYDSRKESDTYNKIQTIFLGENDYNLVQLPPNVWYAFKAISIGHAIIANCTTEPHSPDESEVLPLDTNIIPFHWENNAK